MSNTDIQRTSKKNLQTGKLLVSVTPNHFLGLYISLVALQTAHPTATPGDYAQIDPGPGTDVMNYLWDVDEGWIEGGGGSMVYPGAGIPISTGSAWGTSIPAGADGKVLTMVSGAPAWADAPIGLPSMTGNGGKFLTTNGTVASWTNITAWGTSGNAGTDGGTTNFIGTTDNKQLMFKINSANALLLSTKGPYGRKLTLYNDYNSNIILDTDTGNMAQISLGQYGSYTVIKADGTIKAGSNRTITFIGSTASIDNFIVARNPSTGSGNILSCRYDTTASDFFRVYAINNIDAGFVGVGLGVTVTASSILKLESTTKGFLPPRMTTTQKNSITSPAAGLIVYDNVLNQMSYYNGTNWINF